VTGGLLSYLSLRDRALTASIPHKMFTSY